MPEAVATQSTETTSTSTNEPHNLIDCPRCGSERFKRISRAGLMHRYIFPIFGYYPWKCARCGATSMMKKRAQPSRHHGRKRKAGELDAKESALGTPVAR